jgi:hypothetical protein
VEANRTTMLLRHRSPDLDTRPATLRPGLEHLDQRSVAVLRWLNAHKIDFVVIGPVAHALRGDASAHGPVAIVPAPYRRNWERLAVALQAQNAGLRGDHSGDGGGPAAIKLDGEKLAAGRHWLLRFSGCDLDVEGLGTHAASIGSGRPAASPPGYQELLYESARVEIADEVVVEVAAPEDLEHFSQVRRTGTAPEFRITRNPVVEPSDA